MSYQAPALSRTRQAIFPIADWELKKFIPMAIMIFITIFNFTWLRNAKDALFVTAPGSGAEAIPFLKLYVVMPMTILFSLLYVKIRKVYDFQQSYYIIIGFFMGFFLLFALVLYPNVESIHLSLSTVSYLKESFPRIQHFFPIFAVWSYSLFYVFAELWGTFCLSILFWQFANDNVGRNEAKRFYPLLILTSNGATIILGFVMMGFGKMDPAAMIFNGVMMLAVLAAIMVYSFWWLNNKVLIDPKYTADVSDKGKKKKLKLGFVDSIRQTMKSPYIGCIALLVLSYGILINVIEVTWKSQVKQAFGDVRSYFEFMSTYTVWTGIASLVFVFISKSLIRTRGWFTCAVITPIIVGVTGVVFFAYMLFQDMFSSVLVYFGGISALTFAVWFGCIGLVLGKSAKYSFFDPTKEMAFIPLDYDLRMTGKAAADGVGARLGKAGGGFIQSSLFILLGASSQIALAPYLTVIVVLLAICWIFAVTKLSGLYNEQVKIAEQAEKS